MFINIKYEPSITLKIGYLKTRKSKFIMLLR